MGLELPELSELSLLEPSCLRNMENNFDSVFLLDVADTFILISYILNLQSSWCHDNINFNASKEHYTRIA